MRKGKNQVARIDNQLVMKAHYSLSSNEQKLILFLVSKIDADSRDDFNIQRVKIKDIEKFFAEEGKRWGSIYERVDMMCNNITDKKITLPKGFVVEGKPIKMHRYIQWFTDIEPYEDEEGEICLKFQFADSLKSFLLQLSEYVRINLLEVLPMRGKYAIRMYQIFKSERDRTKKFRKISYLTYGLDELKAMLNIGNKYSRLQNFKDRVLNPIIKEINEYSQEISVEYELLKTRRTVTGIEFSIKSKEEISKKLQNVDSSYDYVPTDADLNKLTWAQRNAYDTLVKFKVKEGIALRQILQKVKGGNMEGFEDLFINKSIAHFKKWAKQQKTQDQSAGTFVNWWTKKKVFAHDNDVYWKISETVNEERKGMEQERLDNRMIAKDMTKDEFVKWYRETEKAPSESSEES